MELHSRLHPMLGTALLFRETGPARGVAPRAIAGVFAGLRLDT
jgi:hypothetical protein